MFLANTLPIHEPWGASVDRARSFHASAQPSALREDAMQVLVRRDGNVYFRGQLVVLDQLPDHIRRALREGAEKKVYLSVDARSKYGDTAAVVDQIRLAGIDSISFITNNSEGH
jgi:biopolymer transport protein ExbD